MPGVEAQLERGMLTGVVGQLAENERGAERRAGRSIAGGEIDRVQCREADWRNDIDPVRPVLVVPLV